MLAYRDCVYDKEAALALAAEESGSRYIHGILSETGPERFGIPLALGGLGFVLLDQTDIPDFLAAIHEGADLSRVADRFALWALQTYARACTEGDAAARRHLDAACGTITARLAGQQIGDRRAAALRMSIARPVPANPRTIGDCAQLATWSVVQMLPGSAAMVAYAGLRAEVLIAGRDDAARQAMRRTLQRLLAEAPVPLLAG